jgi:hypothetical protein
MRGGDEHCFVPRFPAHRGLGVLQPCVLLRDRLRLPGDPCSGYASAMRYEIFFPSLALLALNSGCGASLS